jgi:hypothetical protein
MPCHSQFITCYYSLNDTSFLKKKKKKTSKHAAFAVKYKELMGERGEHDTLKESISLS